MYLIPILFVFILLLTIAVAIHRADARATRWERRIKRQLKGMEDREHKDYFHLN